jgi:hypothetical protein
LGGFCSRGRHCVLLSAERSPSENSSARGRSSSCCSCSKGRADEPRVRSTAPEEKEAEAEKRLGMSGLISGDGSGGDCFVEFQLAEQFMAHVVAFSIGNMARHNIRTQSPVAAHLQPIAVHRYKARGQAPKIIAQLYRSFAVCRTVSGADVTFAAVLLHLPVPSNGLCARVTSALPGSHDPLQLKILSSPPKPAPRMTHRMFMYLFCDFVNQTPDCKISQQRMNRSRIWHGSCWSPSLNYHSLRVGRIRWKVRICPSL